MAKGRAVAAVVLTIALLLVLVAAGDSRWLASVEAAPPFTTTYQALLLDDGQVFYGKLERLGTPYPVLREVYYIQEGVNQRTQQPASVLLRKGREWHEPDRMIVNAEHILMVEPVAPGSKVAELIKELKYR